MSKTIPGHFLEANSSKAAKARGAWTVPGPPFIEMATPRASATSSEVAPRRAGPLACDAMQPSHCLATEMASAISSLVLASSAPSTEPFCAALIRVMRTRPAQNGLRDAHTGKKHEVGVPGLKPDATSSMPLDQSGPPAYW